MVAVMFCLVALLVPASAFAHDDPVLTIRVLSQGITDGQIDTAMGEVDDNAMINVDKPVAGREEIIAWIQHQLTLNLRIEVFDITPTQTADGYDVTWTTHMYREDWRKAGVPMRQTTEHASIHNGRVTQWTSSLGTQLASASGANAPQPANARQSSAAQQPAAAAPTTSGRAAGPSIGGVPVSQIPVGIIALVLLLAAVATLVLRSAVRRPRRADSPRVVSTIESLAPRAAERKP